MVGWCHPSSSPSSSFPTLMHGVGSFWYNPSKWCYARWLSCSYSSPRMWGSLILPCSRGIQENISLASTSRSKDQMELVPLRRAEGRKEREGRSKRDSQTFTRGCPQAQGSGRRHSALLQTISACIDRFPASLFFLIVSRLSRWVPRQDRRAAFLWKMDK